MLSPCLKVNVIFYLSNKINKLCKPKCQLPLVKHSNVIFKVDCIECSEFYIGLTMRRLETRLNEHDLLDKS